ncbi:hypothetical protein [Limibacillus halophilus]|uniref:Uncharacterized protein n=1 Tax=Limibacillus halophilus TaxID=1579333 RepID=A0A839SWS9_9PROT|nr:hypothetical protein [Limibacillus halophilus]MBB3066509.1 hypothetical protein [Limibacillus halophilus]
MSIFYPRLLKHLFPSLLIAVLCGLPIAGWMLNVARAQTEGGVLDLNPQQLPGQTSSLRTVGMLGVEFKITPTCIVERLEELALPKFSAEVSSYRKRHSFIDGSLFVGCTDPNSFHLVRPPRTDSGQGATISW